MHLQKASGLESDLILYMAETLVHRGESSFAWKIWTAFDLNLAALPAVATEYAVMVNLELGAWERALSVVRATRRLDLLPLVFKWLVRSAKMRDFVHHTTLSPREERVFDAFMMGDRALADALSDEAIRKADLLVMYYVLRNRFDDAWAAHHEHLALLRESTAGDVHVAQSVLGRASFQARAALLQNMRAEPVELASREFRFKRSTTSTATARAALPASTSDRVMNEADVLMLAGQEEPAASAFSTMMRDGDHDDEDEDHEMTDAAPRLTTTTAAAAAASAAPTPSPKTPPRPSKPSDYSPGIFSSRSSHPRPTPKRSDQPAFQRHGSWAGDASTPARAPRSTVPIGSVDSSPDSPPQQRRRHSLDSSAQAISQTLRFGVSTSTLRPNEAPSTGTSFALICLLWILTDVYDSMNRTACADARHAADALALQQLVLVAAIDLEIRCRHGRCV
ncbi:hypothetical protein PINS_up002336 [Pythium insidiosum]|nr:hypothetical protein PINS_up002336 [Pythium insidiosum]